MATISTIRTAFDHALRIRKFPARTLFFWLLVSLFACRSTNQSGSGSQKKLRIAVGKIKEISMPNRGDGSLELIGASDNQEIVEVSRRQLAPAIDTLKRDRSGLAIFQIKGITVGTAKVIFSTKPLNQTGNGVITRTYIVQVTAK